MRKSMFLTGLLFVFILLACGCTTEKTPSREAPLTPIPTKGQNEVDPTREPYVPNLEPTELDMVQNNVKTIGRTFYDGQVRWCTYSGSGIEFFFAGRECTIHLVSDDQYDDPVHAARVAVYVDGERTQDFLMDEPEKDVTIIRREDDTIAYIRVIKISEVSDSVLGIGKATVVGMVSPLTDLPLKIEFIGDSITCGYGVDGRFEVDTYKTANEDCTKAYAYLAAERLNADYSLVSMSGYGIVSGYTATGEKLGDKIIPQYYETLGNSYATFGDGFRCDRLPWDFTQFTPDIVVINLGTNDSSYCKDEAKCREYIDGYKDFLVTVRKRNPEAKIICTLGIMGTELCESMETAVAEFKMETGDESIWTMRFEEQNQERDGVVVDWHPSAATHLRAAVKLSRFITDLLNQEAVDRENTTE